MKGGITRIGIREAGRLSKGKGVLATYLDQAAERCPDSSLYIFHVLDEDEDVYLFHVSIHLQLDLLKSAP